MWKVKQMYSQKCLIHLLALPLASSMILGESLHFSQLLFSHWKMVTPLTDLPRVARKDHCHTGGTSSLQTPKCRQDVKACSVLTFGFHFESQINGFLLHMFQLTC